MALPRLHNGSLAPVPSRQRIAVRPEAPADAPARQRSVFSGPPVVWHSPASRSWHSVERAEHASSWTNRAGCLFQPMRPTQPDAFKTGRGIARRQSCFFEPRESRSEETVFLELQLNCSLQPWRMPRAKNSPLVATAEKAGVAFHRKLSQRPGRTRLKGGLPVDRSAVGQTLGASFHPCDAAQEAALKLVLIVQSSESVWQTEHRGRQPHTKRL